MAKFEEKSSFEAVYVSNRWRVMNAIQVTLNCKKEQAEDLCCNVFIKVAKYFPTFDKTKSSFNTWLYNITSQVIIDYKRSKAGKKRYQTEYIDDKVNSEGEVYFQIEGNKDMKADAKLELTELEKLVEKTISSFNEIQQKVCRLQIEGFQMQEIAKEVNIPEGTVKVYVFRFRKELKSKLEKQK